MGITGVFGQFRGLQHIDDFAGQYDVVSFDPRGIGQSSPIRCDPNAASPVSEPVYRSPTPAEFDALARANGAFFHSCLAATGELMAHLSAVDTAADIERIRQALSPNEGLVAYAGSYGTVYAAAYLERYGDRVKAMVLDAVVDHSIDLPTMITRNILSVADAFDRFAQWCDRDSTCALHGQDPGKVFDAVGATAPVTRTLVPQLLAAGRDPQLGWPAIAQMLAQTSRGETSVLDKLTKTASLSSTTADPWVDAGTIGLSAGVQCSDFGPQRDYAALVAAGAAVAAGRRASLGNSGMRRRLRTARPALEIASVGLLKRPIRHITFRLDRTPMSWWQTVLTIRQRRSSMRCQYGCRFQMRVS